MLLDIVVATNNVWHEVSCTLKGRMRPNAIYTFVHQNRHGVKEKLGFTKDEKIKIPNDGSIQILKGLFCLA